MSIGQGKELGNDMKKEGKWSNWRGGGVFFAMVIAAMMLCLGCSSGEQEANDSGSEPAAEVVETEAQQNPADEVGTAGTEEVAVPTISWKDAGLEDHVMDWKDTNLETAMREITGITTGDIMLSDVWGITELDLSERGISNVSALSDLTNLQMLFLNDNEVSDVSALSNLTNLRGLFLENNAISDVSTLSGLTNLRQLWLFGNSIDDHSSVDFIPEVLDDLDIMYRNAGDVDTFTQELREIGYDEICLASSLYQRRETDSTTGVTYGSVGMNYFSVKDGNHYMISEGKGEETLVLYVPYTPVEFSCDSKNISMYYSQYYNIEYNDDNNTTNIEYISSHFFHDGFARGGTYREGSITSDGDEREYYEMKGAYISLDFVAFKGNDVPVNFSVTFEDGSTQEMTVYISRQTMETEGGEVDELTALYNDYKNESATYFALALCDAGYNELCLIDGDSDTTTFFSVKDGNHYVFQGEDYESILLYVPDIPTGFSCDNENIEMFYWYKQEGYNAEEYEKNYITLGCLDFEGDDVPVNIYVTFEDGATRKLTVYFTRHAE